MLTGNAENLIQTYCSREVIVGKLKLGGNYPVRVQSMTNTDTNDLEASLNQCEALILAGAELVRLTTQGKKEVDSIREIRKKLIEKGFEIPVIADIHFNPALAEYAVPVVDKIRINPGNYIINRGDPDDNTGLAKDLLSGLIRECKKHQTAIRIGVNHGSLSERILMKYGDTPEGMTESALEFIRICNELGFHQIIISLKSSNTKVMIHSVRLLVNKMQAENLSFPLHLGVTEAGDDLYGRIKSTVGIAPLLLEGMGDTIRISLTENPENEIPVAKKITQLFTKPSGLPYDPFRGMAWDAFSYQRRISLPVHGIGGGKPPVIITDFRGRDPVDLDSSQILPFISSNTLSLFEKGNLPTQQVKHNISEFCKINSTSPIVYKCLLKEIDLQDFQLRLAGELGFLLIEGVIDAVWVENEYFSTAEIYDLLMMILQASGARISKTEYIACPSCGRTHFNIETRLAEIKKATSHLKHLKIGVMGCIVNGPGEMADADYGYVGIGKNKVSIYRNRDVVYKNIPEEAALNMLLTLIKERGDWVDP